MNNVSRFSLPDRISENPCHDFMALISKARVILIIMMTCLVLTPTFAQQKISTDTLRKTTHSITRAAVSSAILPGLGQAYNRKYWKIPIVYAGFGVLSYFIVTNTKEFRIYREAYVYTANGDTNPIDNPYVGRYNLSQLEQAMTYYGRNRDLSWIITGLWYVLNILDAYVDANLWDYDISEDLSLHWEPSVAIRPQQPGFTSGVRIILNF
jgi:hypothetical protein